MMFRMTDEISRRTLLGTALAAAAAPSLGFAQTSSNAARTGAKMRIRIAFFDHAFTATLDDNPTARDLFSMLPLDLSIEDYSNNEKIAYPPRKLTEAGRNRFGNEAPGDICYYAPWGNIVFYYAGYRYDPGLIRLGRLDGGIDPLMTRGTFPLRIERA